MLFIATSELVASAVLNSFNYSLTNKDERTRMKIDNVTIDYKLDSGMLSVEFLDYDGEHFKINLFAFDKKQDPLGSYTLSSKDTDNIFIKIKSFLYLYYSDRDYYDPWVAIDMTHRIKNNWPFKIY